MKKIAIISFVSSICILAYLSYLNQSKGIDLKELKEDSIQCKKIGKNNYSSFENDTLIVTYSNDECNLNNHQGNCLKCNVVYFY